MSGQVINTQSKLVKKKFNSTIQNQIQIQIEQAKTTNDNKRWMVMVSIEAVAKEVAIFVSRDSTLAQVLVKLETGFGEKWNIKGQPREAKMMTMMMKKTQYSRLSHLFIILKFQIF